MYIISNVFVPAMLFIRLPNCHFCTRFGPLLTVTSSYFLKCFDVPEITHFYAVIHLIHCVSVDRSVACIFQITIFRIKKKQDKKMVAPLYDISYVFVSSVTSFSSFV